MRFEHGYGVIIGVGRDLPVTERDAEAVHSFLISSSRCAFPKENLELLCGERATRVNVLAALERLERKVESDPTATAIVYFSGHGTGGAAPRLITYDYDPEHLAASTLSAAEFTALLRAIRSRKLVVFLDCCHASGQADAKQPPREKEPIPIEALEEFEKGSGRVVLASSRRDEYSLTSHPNSHFTQALCEALSGHGASERDGYIRILDLALYVAHAVPDRTFEQQHPVLKVAHLEQDFKVAYYAAGDEEPKGLLPLEPRPLLEGPGEPVGQATLWLHQLQQVQGERMVLEQRIAEYRSRGSAPGELLDREARARNQILHLKGKLGLLPETEQYSRVVTRLWSVLGVVTFWFSLAVWSHTQSWPLKFPPSLFGDWGRYSVSILGILFGLPLFALLLIFTWLYQDPRLRPGLLNRLPVAFAMPFHTETRLRKSYQAAFLFFFLLFPMAAQTHFFLKMCRGKAWDSTERLVVAVGVDQHLTRVVPLGNLPDERWHRYRHQDLDGTYSKTFYPFWQPWLFLLLEVGLAVFWLRVLLKMSARGATPSSPPLEA